MQIAFGLQLASKIRRKLKESVFPAIAGATDIFLTVTGKICSCCKALRLLPSSSNSAHLPPSSFNFQDTTIPQNPLVATPCGFESHHRHQTNKIRTRSSLWETGSDFVFSTGISISPTVHSAAPNPSREDRERRNQNDLEVSIMRKLISCEFNMDTACVELRYTDGTLISIDCTEVEYQVAHTVKQRSALDYLIYNAPLEYANLILSGDIKRYLEIE